MPAPRPRTHHAHSALVCLIVLELELLLVRYRLEDKSNAKHSRPHIIPSPKLRRLPALRVDQRHWEAHDPHPHRLPQPETCKLQREAPIELVEPRVLARLEHADQQVARQPRPPHHDARGDEDLAGEVGVLEQQPQDGEEHKVCSSCKVGDLVELKVGRDDEEGELHQHRHAPAPPERLPDPVLTHGLAASTRPVAPSDIDTMREA
mmetsp:Transcript_36393/g.71080  ORF Transcript_36393/g.71080 Transcript_36393/m.71080 type:complete len:206 (-) Transcript_36393:61-678(-)